MSNLNEKYENEKENDNTYRKDTTLFDDAIRMVREEQYLRAFDFLSERLWNRLFKLYLKYPLPQHEVSKVRDFYVDGEKNLKGLITGINACLKEKYTLLDDEEDAKLLKAIEQLENLWDKIRTIGIEPSMTMMTVEMFQKAVRWLERVDFDFHDKFKETEEILEELEEVDKFGFDYSALYKESNEESDEDNDDGRTSQ